MLGHLVPGHGERTLYTVLSLQFQVGLSDFLQLGMAVPGSAVENGCDVGGSAHGTEFLVVLVGVDVLGLVHLQRDVGRIAHHVGMGLGAEEDLPGLAEDHGISRLDAPVAPEVCPVQSLLETIHSDKELGDKGWRCLYHVAAQVRANVKKIRRELGAKLVLSTLSGDLDGEGEALTEAHAFRDGVSDVGLVFSQGASFTHVCLFLCHGAHYHVGNDGGQNNQHQVVNAPLHFLQLLLQKLHAKVE